jgi:hypothetical protein
MMIIVSPGRIAIARKGQDAGKNEAFLNHGKAAILRRRRLRSRRVRIPRIAQRTRSALRRHRGIKKTSFGLLIITGSDPASISFFFGAFMIMPLSLQSIPSASAGRTVSSIAGK